MNLYLVIQWHYDIVFSSYTIEYIYTDKKAAGAKMAELNLNNPDPVVEDYYGPMTGCEFKILERKTDDATR